MQVSLKAIIRELDSEELLTLLSVLKDKYYDNHDEIKLIKKYYKQLTGEEIYCIHNSMISI